MEIDNPMDGQLERLSFRHVDEEIDRYTDKQDREREIDANE